MSNTETTRNGVTLEVGKTYKIDHTRKGKWSAKCLTVDGEWATFSDDAGSPIRLSLFNAEEV